MSYSFSAALTTYMSCATGAPRTATPLSIIGWVKANDTAVARDICAIWYSVTATNYFQLGLISTDVLRAVTRSTSPVVTAAATTSVPPFNAWVLTHGCWGSGDSDREVGYNAANYVTDATACTPTFTVDRISVGARQLTTANPWDGLIAIVGVYDVKLSHGQLDELLVTAPDLASSAGSLVALYDMRTDHGTTTVSDSIGSLDLTLGGSSTNKPTYSSDNPTFTAAGVTARMALLGVG